MFNMQFSNMHERNVSMVVVFSFINKQQGENDFITAD